MPGLGELRLWRACYTFSVRLDWDEGKAGRNFAKHGVSFQEATAVFGDPLGWTYPDSRHSEYEQRWITVGMSAQHRVLVVAHSEEAEVIRMISAREATRQERRFYEDRRG